MTVRRDWLLAARLGYVAVILLATLSELHFDPDAATVAERLQRAVAPAIQPRDLVDGLRNIVLFAGWGLVWSITAPPGRLWRSVLTATVTGLLLSTVVEAAQLFSPRRHSSILDVVTNTGGAAFGSVATVLLLRATARASRARSFVGVPIFLVTASYVAAAALEIALPGLRQELLPGTAGGPLARLRYAFALAWWELPRPGEFIVQFLLMAPAGALLVAAFVEAGRSYRSAAALAAAAGLATASLMQLARAMTGQPFEPGFILVHFLGIAAGAALAWRFLAPLTTRLRGSRRPLALYAAGTLVVLLWRWRPFIPTLDLDHIRASFTAAHLLPLHSLAERMDIFSAAVVTVGFLLHFPLGALLAVWPLRRTGSLAHVLPGLWAVIAIELGQVFIVDRYFDVTDIIIGAAGVIAGWVLVRRAGFRPYGEALPRRAFDSAPARR